MFTKALAPFVNVRTRAKGLQYLRARAASSTSPAPSGSRTRLSAALAITGSSSFATGTGSPGRASARITPIRAEICKHIWAALLEAEDRRLLGGDGPVGDDAVLDPEYRPSAADVLEQTEIGYSGAGVRTAAVKAPQWQRFLHELRQDVAAAEGAVPLPRFSNGEIVYAVDVRETLAGRGTVVSVFFRQRRKSGAWTKPKPVGVTPAEAEHMVDRDDREILSLLIGASNAWYQSAPDRSRLPSSVPLCSERTAGRSGAADAGPHRACASRQHE